MTTNINDLLRGGQCDLPKEVDICPECGSELYIDCDEWDSKTGFPSREGFSVNCKHEEEELDKWTDDDDDTRDIREVMHRHWQSDWQPVIDRVWKWIEQQREKYNSNECKQEL